MKRKKTAESGVLNDALAAPPAMIRTQIYLTRAEYDFVQLHAQREGEPMASIIRRYIDEKMHVPVNAWEENPMLRESVADPAFQSPEDGVLNHDHYIYGTPKRYVKERDAWTAAPPLPSDYHENQRAAAEYHVTLNEGSKGK